MSRESYRRTRSNEAKIWYEPVIEQKAGPGKGNRKKKPKKKYNIKRFNLKQIRLRSGPQYKLFAFVDKFFKGNVSKAAKEFEMKKSRLASIINRGVLKKDVIAHIVLMAQKIDPGQTEKKLFIPPRRVVVLRRKREDKGEDQTPVIRPSMGGFVSIGPGPISAAIARMKGVA